MYVGMYVCMYVYEHIAPSLYFFCNPILFEFLLVHLVNCVKNLYNGM
jgi:hypothetical protein